MDFHDLLLPFIWTLNGFLAVLYLLWEHMLAVLLLPSFGYLLLHTPKTQRNWMSIAAGLAVLAAAFAPPLIGIWLLLMALGSIIALRLEKFNPENLHWRVISGIASYALVGLGFLLYHDLSPVITDPTFVQGKGYLDILIGIAVYLGPLGFLGLLVQAIFAHPPLKGSPEDIIYNVRTRGGR